MNCNTPSAAPSTTYEQVVERIGKLLRLAKSDNVNESAAAMAKAQALMLEYQISEVPPE